MSKKLTRIGVIVFFLMALSPIESFAITGAPTGSALTRSYVWYDGNRERTVWVDPSLVIEFTTANVSQSSLKRMLPDAKLHSSVGKTIHIWNIGSTLDPQAVIQNLKAKKSLEKYSPVFHEGPSTSSRKRALPGNIIVYLKPEWSQDEVDRWVKKSQLQVIQKLNFGPYVYLVKTSEGLDALNRANQLYKGGEVLAATPEWWEDLRVK